MRHTPKLLAVLTLVLVAAGSATAAGVLITSSKQIRNGTIRAADLHPKARAAFAEPGPPGAKGDPGAKGEAGAKGEPGADAEPSDALRPGDIRVNGQDVSGKEEVGAGWHTVAGALSRGSDEPGRGLLLAAVTLTGPGQGAAATVEGRLLIDGEVVSDGWRTTLAAGESRVLSLQASPYLEPGDHQFDLQVQTTGETMTVGGRSVDMIAFRPIWNPPRPAAGR